MRASFSSLLISLLALAGAAQAAPPARLEIAYDFLRGGAKVADVLQKLEHGAGRYQIVETWEGRGVLRVLGAARRTSRGEVRPEGLRPLEFTDSRTGRDTERATFDWGAKTVTYQYKGAPRTEPLPPQPSDSLHLLYHLAFHPPAPRQFSVDVVGGKGVSDQLYRLDSRERLRIAAGEFETVKYVRTKENGERAELWFSERDYLPLRILLTGRDGSRVEQVAVRIGTP